MYRLIPLIFVALLAATGCAGTLPDTTDASAAEPIEIEETVRVVEPADPAKKLVCRIERPTGSHMARKRCFTAEEREKMSRQSRDWVLSGGRNGATYEVKDDADPRE